MLQTPRSGHNRKMASTPVTKQKSATVSHPVAASHLGQIVAERGVAKQNRVADRRQAEQTKKDLRIIRTRRQIDAAFVEIIHHRAYGNIRVSDIAKKAGVGRATFYAHYISKDDLLRSQFRRIVAPMISIRTNDPCPDATALFAHMKSSPRIYKALMSGHETGNAPRVLRECFEDAMWRPLANHAVSEGDPLNSSVQASMVKRFLGASLLAVIEGWLEQGAPGSPQEVQKVFRKLVGGGLGALRAHS